MSDSVFVWRPLRQRSMRSTPERGVRARNPRALLLAAIVFATPVMPKDSAAQDTNVVVVLTHDGQLVQLNPTTGRIDASARVGAVPIPGHFMAGSSGKGEVFVATPVSADSSLLSLWNTASHALRPTITFAGEVVSMRVGARSGRVYAFLSCRRGVLIFDPTGSRVVRTIRLPAELPRSGAGGVATRPCPGTTIDGAVSADEDRLYISDHNEGVEVFAINSNSVKVVCDGMPYARSGKCMYGAHGSVAPGKNRSLLAAGGSSTIFEHDSSGVLVARHQMGIPGNHTMDFAADTVRGIMFIAGACEQSAGFSAKEVGASGAARVFVASVPRGANKPEGYVPMPTDPPPGSICGSRLALSPDGNVLVLGGRRGPREGIVFVVDPVTGRIGSRAWLGGEVADVIVVRR